MPGATQMTWKGPFLGGNGFDLLMGGHGADRIIGNAGDDIMISGNLSFADRDEAVWAVMVEWISEPDYYTRIHSLSDPTRDYFLRLGETVTDDDDRDVLTGAAGLDWFFFDRDNDRATDLKDEVFANDLEWILAP